MTLWITSSICYFINAERGYGPSLDLCEDGLESRTGFPVTWRFLLRGGKTLGFLDVAVRQSTPSLCKPKRLACPGWRVPAAMFVMSVIVSISIHDQKVSAHPSFRCTFVILSTRSTRFHPLSSLPLRNSSSPVVSPSPSPSVAGLPISSDRCCKAWIVHRSRPIIAGVGSTKRRRLEMPMTKRIPSGARALPTFPRFSPR